jgi:hypothetical protein
VHSNKIFILIAGIFLASCTPANVEAPALAVAQSPSSLPPTVTSSPIDDELKQLATAFSSLRATPGHFDGGEWNNDVDQWQGRKHTLMLELASRLGTGDTSRSTLTDLLGPPDHIVKGGDPLLDLIQTVPAYQTAVADEYLVYEWRGTHDFLFFVGQDGRITAADWWYAGE